MEWDDYRHFLAIEQAGSVLGAAKQLGVNHTTVLRRIASLERRLGVRLFERLRTGYTPTPAGEELRNVILGVRQVLLDVEHRLSGKDLQLSGVVRIATTDTLSHGLLLPHLRAFRQLHPHIQLQIIGSNQIVSLTRREADIAIRATNQPPDNMLGRKIGLARSAIYGALSYLDERGHDLASDRHDWIGLDETLAHLPEYRWLERRIPPERIVLRLNNLLHKIAVVKAGHGIAPLLCFLAEREPDLIRLTEPEPLFDTDIWLLSHPDLRRVARVRAFMEFITQCAKTDRLLQGELVKHQGLARPAVSAVNP
ncbi:MAG TPA: LysR family transcriptional regulator [Candidatus Competibacter sp.]|jgi:DNA-binding transcriptional LysR family regulator|nr:LysR family transcriptional regulator [Candidatus Competibacter sp.]HRX59925.1 LysR family transcriptional regulator [Candidatus Competibacter sp.]HUM89759.1 LysR family transcriptional regulator [Candidatus Competibacter sp.]